MARLILILLIALVFEAVGVVWLSQGLKQMGEVRQVNLAEIKRLVSHGLTNRYILLGVLFETIFFVTLLVLLKNWDVSLIWPLTSLGFVITTLAAKYLRHEEVSRLRWSGVILLLFIVYHLLHFTIGVHAVHPQFVHGDAYHNFVTGFQNPLVSGFYILAMLALGGAMGNLVDRIRYGWVVDFIDISLRWGGRDHHWPTFNVADIAIFAGADPIVFVGADLAYTGGRPYCRGASWEDGWAELTGRGGELEARRQRIHSASPYE
jgi:multidrug transporter EmrE-like cation transporter